MAASQKSAHTTSSSPSKESTRQCGTAKSVQKKRWRNFKLFKMMMDILALRIARVLKRRLSTYQILRMTIPALLSLQAVFQSRPAVPFKARRVMTLQVLCNKGPWSTLSIMPGSQWRLEGWRRQPREILDCEAFIFRTALSIITNTSRNETLHSCHRLSSPAHKIT